MFFFLNTFNNSNNYYNNKLALLLKVCNLTVRYKLLATNNNELLQNIKEAV